jgi:hypothetical protein
METYGGDGLELQAFLNSKVDGRFASRKSAFYVHRIGGHISSRVDFDTTVKRKCLA